MNEDPRAYLNLLGDLIEESRAAILRTWRTSKWFLSMSFRVLPRVRGRCREGGGVRRGVFELRRSLLDS